MTAWSMTDEERRCVGCGTHDLGARAKRCGPCATTRNRARARRAAVDRRARARRSNVRAIDTLGCLCWCETEVVYVTPADIRAGRTDTCGAPACVPL